VKPPGKPGAGKPHAGFDVAGIGDGAMERENIRCPASPRQSSTLHFEEGVGWCLASVFVTRLNDRAHQLYAVESEFDTEESAA
jgi:hypothetical protein